MNHGSISGNFGIAVGDAGTGASGARIQNTGAITGRTAQGVFLDGAGHRLENTGTISALNGVGVQATLSDAGSVTIVDDGVLRGQDAAVSVVGSGTAAFTSGGRVYGDVALVNSLGSVVRNTGTMTGFLLDGPEADTFVLLGGVVTAAVRGEGGNDTYLIDRSDVRIEEGSAGGIDSVESSADFVLPAHVERLTLTGPALRGTGNGPGNTITGSDGHDILHGLGGIGFDWIDGGSANDAAFGDEGDGMIAGRTGDDLLEASAGADALSGGAGADALRGWTGADILAGGAGADHFIFDGTADSTVAMRGRILDFERGKDRIVMQFDGNPGRAGLEPLLFIGSASFTAPAQVRATFAGGVATVWVSTVGSGGPGMQFLVTSASAPTADAFLFGSVTRPVSGGDAHAAPAG